MTNPAHMQAIQQAHAQNLNKLHVAQVYLFGVADVPKTLTFGNRHPPPAALGRVAPARPVKA